MQYSLQHTWSVGSEETRAAIKQSEKIGLSEDRIFTVYIENAVLRSVAKSIRSACKHVGIMRCIELC